LDVGDQAFVFERADQVDDRVLLAFPSVSWSGALAPGLRAASAVGDARWVLDVAGTEDRRLRVEADLGLLPTGAPGDVAVLDAAWHRYDPTTGVLRAELAGGRLEVRSTRPLTDLGGPTR